MLFNSFAFVVFLLLVLAVYYPLPHRAQNVFLLVASCVFYASWDWRFLVPLLFSTTIDFFCAQRMQQISERGELHAGRKRYLLISVIANLSLLGFFKYFNFFAGSMERLLNVLGAPVSPWALHIILPVGISFYTFQALSYTIDVYRGELHPTKSFWDFLLAILYFPHLVAGPIQRAHSLLPQVIQKRRITKQMLGDGVHLMVCGYFKKVFVADNLAPMVNQVFAMPSPSGFQTMMGCYGFAMQIYCDFSGYTDIARGVAKLMGFEFMLNFNLPYFATSPTEFWRRWHISLSSWLRDYLYISLGGNRGAAWKVKRNVLLTMVIGGLWHGAAWNFVLWGMYHGVLLVGDRALKPWGTKMFRARNAVGCFVSVGVRVAVMFGLTCYGWMLFRAGSLHQIGVMTESLGHPLMGVDWSFAGRMMMYSCPVWVVQMYQFARKKLMFMDVAWLPVEVRTVIYAVAVYFVLFLGGQPKSFIYFQF
ncbi:MAG: MBOAT family O-acyltransferase [Acidobacteriota bacterium]